MTNNKQLIKIKEWIENKIDHYTSYQPIGDTFESIEVRKVLFELTKFIDKEIMRLKNE